MEWQQKTSCFQGLPLFWCRALNHQLGLPGREHRLDISVVRHLRRLEMCLRHPADPIQIPQQVHPTYSVSTPPWCSRNAKIPPSAMSKYRCNFSPCAVVPLGVGTSYIDEMLWETRRGIQRGNLCQPLWWLGDVGRRCLETGLGTPHWDGHSGSVTGNHVLN